MTVGLFCCCDMANWREIKHTKKYNDGLQLFTSDVKDERGIVITLSINTVAF